MELPLRRASGLSGQQPHPALATATDGDACRVPLADFSVCPPDARLVDRLGIARCLSLGVLPWRRAGGAVLVAGAAPDRVEALRPMLEAALGPVRAVPTDQDEMRDALLAIRSGALIREAETHLGLENSSRKRMAVPARRVWIGLLALGAAGIAAEPRLAFVLLICWALFWLGLSVAFKAAAAVAMMTGPRRVHRAAPTEAPRPRIAILVPLYKERHIAGHLVARLSRLTYPKDRLEVSLVVEADDAVTRDTLAGIVLPDWMQIITVPAGQVKTKPRALNYALPFCRGEIVGVYDAEDAPAPDQLDRVAEAFAVAPPEVACLQGILDFYNARQNWLARCFAIEYAAWFRVILPGFARLGLVLPLGGTTLFFRRPVLEEIGGWDAHNVTEDADLGVRLARAGYRTELIETVTSEEANAWIWPWVKQRSRWLKGYAQTWAVHMRRPGQLWRELGTWRFIGLQVLFLGTLTQFLLMPLIWSFWPMLFGIAHPIGDYLPWPALQAIWGLFILSEAVNVGVSALAVTRAGRPWLIPWAPTMQLYFPLATLAVVKGLAELVFRPFYWDKTVHGRELAEGTEADGGG